MSLPLDVSLQNKKHPLKDLNLADFQDVTVSTDYYMQVYLSEYLIQSLCDALFHNGEHERIDLPVIPMDNVTHWFLWLRLGDKLKNAEHGAFVQDG